MHNNLYTVTIMKCVPCQTQGAPADKLQGKSATYPNSLYLGVGIEFPLKRCELSMAGKACVKCWHRHGNHAYLHASQPLFTCQLTACMLGHQLFIAKYDNIHPAAHILTLFHLSAKQHACLDTGCSAQNMTIVALLSACAVVLHCTRSACSKLSSKHACRNLTKHGAYI